MPTSESILIIVKCLTAITKYINVIEWADDQDIFWWHDPAYKEGYLRAISDIKRIILNHQV